MREGKEGRKEERKKGKRRKNRKERRKERRGDEGREKVRSRGGERGGLPLTRPGHSQRQPDPWKGVEPPEKRKPCEGGEFLALRSLRPFVGERKLVAG